MTLQPLKIGILWAQYGPYHVSRVEALARLPGCFRVHAIELSNLNEAYKWERSNTDLQVCTLCPGKIAERLGFSTLLNTTRRKLRELAIEVCFLPSYWPRQSFAALLAAKSLGIATVMMNESHEGTARTEGLAAFVKSRLVGLFDAALVGGKPQKRYFDSLGLRPERIFTGYDAVDNDFFARRAQQVRSEADKLRPAYNLPEHFFLSLGRFVPKKNLPTLLRAYRQYLNASPAKQTHLVLIGSGEEERRLRALCVELKLAVYDHGKSDSIYSTNPSPGVHFYGFRQIDENPVFYGLADAFILPSSREEWGLVVNEAMASGLPVVVSKAAGCAEDLLEPIECQDACISPSTGRIVDVVTQFGLGKRIRQNGFVFDPESSEELSQVLLLLESNPQLRSTMGLASRRIVEKFSCENFARNALLAADAALAGRRCAPNRLADSAQPVRV